ncbi:MAG: hypothetical protein J3R72DRAFT_446947 [Linnemannia gamsii]|nr:MAG: hypothetical protein J3R72DRAFT_446947 [Linnemannia gamsii]
MFSPPISPSHRMGHHPLSMTGQQHYTEQEIQFPRHQPQSKLQGSVSNFILQGATGGGGYQNMQQMAMASQDNLAMANNHHDHITGAHQERTVTMRSKGRHPLHQEQSSSMHDESAAMIEGRRGGRQSVGSNGGVQEKSLPPIVTSGVGVREHQQQQHQAFMLPTSFALSPPPNRRWSTTNSVPGSPLQYLCVNHEDTPAPSSQADDFDNQSEAPTPALTASNIPASAGHKTELKDDQDYARVTDNAILKSSSQIQPHPPPSTNGQYGGNISRRPDQQQQQQLQQHQLPLRTTNKPTPPHDPFRKTSLSGASRVPFQSMYQPPEPPHQGDVSNNSVPQPYYQDPPVHSVVPSITAARISPIVAIGGAGGGGGAMALTATGRILSSIGGMSGCYGIVGGVPQPAMIIGAAGLPSIRTTATYGGLGTGGARDSPSSSTAKQQRQQLQHQQQQLQREQQQLQQKHWQLQNQHQQASNAPPYGSDVFQAASHQPPASNTTTTASVKTGRGSSNHSTKGKRAGDRKAVDFQLTHMPSSISSGGGRHSGKPHHHQQQQYMPDIVLTLPTPADNGLVSRKEEYFAM